METNLDTATETALGMPEIRLIIGSFLSMRDIQSCRLINQEWSRSFNPFLWHETCVEYREHNDSGDSADLPPIVFKNSQYIRSLCFTEEFPLNALSLQNLVQLKELSITIEQREDAILPFLRDQCSTLEVLSILYNTWETTDDTVERADIYPVITANCPHLRELTIRVGKVSEQAFLAMWKTIKATGVQNLTFDGLDIPNLIFTEKVLGQHGMDKSELVTNVRHLDFDGGVTDSMDGDEILALMLLCPGLESFRGKYFTPLPPSKFYKALMEKSWKSLCSIEMDLEGLDDPQLADVVQCMPSIQTFDAFMPKFGPKACGTLLSHPQGLSCVRTLHFGAVLESSSLQKILEIAPRLEEFESWGSILGEDIMKGRPWACTMTLRYYKLNIVLSNQQGGAMDREMLLHQNRAILKRLSTLIRLEELHIEPAKSAEITVGDYVHFTLEAGLDHLKSMTRLRTLLFQSRKQPMELEEVDWISQHWPRLRHFGISVRKGVILPPEVISRIRYRELGFTYI